MAIEYTNLVFKILNSSDNQMFLKPILPLPNHIYSHLYPEMFGFKEHNPLKIGVHS